MNKRLNENVIEIEINGYQFIVDVEKTSEYYKTQELCDCIGCRNYYAQVKQQLPQTSGFLNKFGIDIEHPDEISWFEDDEKIEYISANYTVCGKMLSKSELTTEVDDNQMIKITIYNESPEKYFPNSQGGAYFCIDVYGFSFPWVLNEPFPKNTIQTQIRETGDFKNSIWYRIKSLFSKK